MEGMTLLNFNRGMLWSLSETVLLEVVLVWGHNICYNTFLWKSF